MPALRNGLSSRVLVTGLTGAFMLTAAPVLLPQMAGLGLVQLAPAHAGVSIGVFYDSLDPHGSWIDHPRYGYVFVPAVSPGWRPYVHGHWIYTKRHGWYWVSDEPFAWAVYHYGRWAYDPVYGWTWVPGNVWAPAWVSWRYGGGYVAWAPIGPYGDGYVYGTPAYYDPPIIEAWVGVPSHRFVAVDVASYVVPVVEINVILGKASKRHNVRYNKGQVDNPFLSRESAQKLTKADIEVREIKATDDPKEAEAGATIDEKEIRTYRAEITKDKPTEKPKQVAKTPDEVKSRPTLTETAKGKRPRGAPPSAAELKPVEQGQKAKPEDQRETKGEEKPDGQPAPQMKQEGAPKQQPEAEQQKQKQKKDAGPKQDGQPAPQMKQEGAPKQQPEPKQQPQQQAPKPQPQPQQTPQKPAPEQQGPAQPEPQPKGPAPAQQAPVPPQGAPQGPGGPPQGGPPGGGGGGPQGGPPPGGGGPQGGPTGGGGGGTPSGPGGPPDRK